MFYILQIIHFLAIKTTTNIRTLKNGGLSHLKIFKIYKNNPKHLHLSGPLEISYPLYLTNSEQLGKSKHTTMFKTLSNEGFVKTPQKKGQIW
jgi:hypothetical protein